MQNASVLLDIDLDFWVQPPRRASTPRTRGRLSGQKRVEPGPAEVLKELRAKGYGPLPRPRVVASHEEAFLEWGRLAQPWSVVHLDAHHDCYGVRNPYEPECGNFLRIACEECVVSRVVWVVPDGCEADAAVEVLVTEKRSPQPAPHGFSGIMAGVPWEIVCLSNLPQLPTIASVDAFTISLSPEWIDRPLFDRLAPEVARVFGIDRRRLAYRKCTSYPEQTAHQALIAEAFGRIRHRSQQDEAEIRREIERVRVASLAAVHSEE